MKLCLRCVLWSLTALGAAMALASASQPAQKPAQEKQAAQYADPKLTYQTYIEAVRRNDLKAGTQCWVFDHDDKGAALDVIVGLWVSMRRLNQAAVKKFGDEGRQAIIKGWRREDVTDQALELTKARVKDADVKITGDSAELKIRWKEDDGVHDPAFEFGDGPVAFRRVNGNWKIDGNKMTGLARGTDYFDKGTWGRMFRDQIAIMNEAADGIERGKLTSAAQLKTLIDTRIEALMKRYEEERQKKDKKGG